MADQIPKIDNAEALEKKLQEILVEGSLYRNFVYTGRNCHFTQEQRGMASAYRYANLPAELKMYCDHAKCKGLTWWKVNDAEVSFRVGFIKHHRYVCKNCGDSTQHYLFIWQEHTDHNIFIKVGQYPPLSIEPSPEMEKALGPEDSELYKKGLIEFQFGHGIGAVAYFRRVLENKINALLDLIEEAARNENVANEHIEEIEAVKKSHHVDDKIKVASGILPSHLKPGGHNPLDKLYGPLSAGLHGESDDECLTIFSEARFVFEFLFKNLTESNAEIRQYVKRLSEPPKK